MIKLEHVVLASPEQMKFIIEGMRNPMNSWGKSVVNNVTAGYDIMRIRSWRKRSLTHAALIQYWYRS